MPKRIHLFSSRTQKLSSYRPRVLAWWRAGRVGSCRFQNQASTKVDAFFISYWQITIVYLFFMPKKRIKRNLWSSVSPQAPTNAFIWIVFYLFRLCLSPTGTYIEDPKIFAEQKFLQKKKELFVPSLYFFTFNKYMLGRWKFQNSCLHVFHHTPNVFLLFQIFLV